MREEHFMVRYVCRHCHRWIGEFDGEWTDPQLGLAQLSSEDQDAMIDFGSDGTVWVKLLCDYCLPVPWMDDLWYN